MSSVKPILKADMPHLTERQRQCLEGFMERKTAKEIGRDLEISHHAVEQHLKAVRRKFGAADTLEAARRYAATTDTTVEPYYPASEVPLGTHTDAFVSQPMRDRLLLRDIATDGPRFIQALTAAQTLAAIGLCGVGMITILLLIVAVADGVAQLTH